MKHACSLIVITIVFTACSINTRDKSSLATESVEDKITVETPKTDSKQSTISVRQDKKTKRFIPITGEPYQGKADAPITLVGFSDYQCAFCAQFAMNTLPSLEKEFITTGTLKYVFKDLPLKDIHPWAFKAAVASHCAGDQGKYWPMHHLLFASSKRLDADNLKRNAQVLGLNISDFDECLQEGGHDEAIRRDVKTASKLKIKVTPTFFIGYTPEEGEPLQVQAMIAGSQPDKLFKKMISDLLRKAKSVK